MPLFWKDNFIALIRQDTQIGLLQVFLDSSNISSLVNIVLFETAEMEYRTVKP